jgi:hypothetical protein
MTPIIADRDPVWCSDALVGGPPAGKDDPGRACHLRGLIAPPRRGGARLTCMSSVAPRSRWWFVITPRWLAWHLFTVVAVFGMLWLGDWQFHRAESGNALSWAYTFEWPVFAAFGLVFWAKTIIDEGKPKTAPADGEDAASPAAGTAAMGLPVTAGQRQAAGADDGADPDLDEYNAYLSRLNKQVQGHGRWHGLR